MTPSPPQLEDHAHFDTIEADFHAALDVSLHPRGPDSLFDIVADLDLPQRSAVVDVGCGRGTQSLELARRFGFHVLGVDPVARHDHVLREVRSSPPPVGSVDFADGTAESMPVDDGSQDLIFCRDSIMYTDLDAATVEFDRVLRPGGRGLAYLVLAGPNLSDAEEHELVRLLGGRLLRPPVIEAALDRAGLIVSDRFDLAGEWGERTQEREGTPGQRLLYASRLLREPDRYISQFGRRNYDIMLGDCYWHVYRLLGKLSGFVCTFTKPSP